MLLLVSVIGEFVDGRNYAENGNAERLAREGAAVVAEKRGEKNRFLFCVACVQFVGTVDRHGIAFRRVRSHRPPVAFHGLRGGGHDDTAGAKNIAFFVFRAGYFFLYKFFCRF